MALGPACFPGGTLTELPILAQLEGGPDFRGLGEGQNLNKSLFGERLAPNIHRDKQFI